MDVACGWLQLPECYCGMLLLLLMLILLLLLMLILLLLDSLP